MTNKEILDELEAEGYVVIKQERLDEIFKERLSFYRTESDKIYDHYNKLQNQGAIGLGILVASSFYIGLALLLFLAGVIESFL